MPWAEGILASDDILHLVRCVPCTVMEKRGHIMALKKDTLCRHNGLCTAWSDMPRSNVKKGKKYVATQCRTYRT